MFGLTVVTAPSEEPVSLDEAKVQIGYAQDIHHEDERIRALIKAARVYCERATGRAFVTQTLRLTLDCFPGGDGIIRLPRPPLISVTADDDNPTLGIKYDDTTGTEQTLDTAYYTVDTACEPGRIGLASGYCWPCTIDELGAVRVTYTAGYGADSAVPDTIKAAMKLLVSHWFESREAAITGTIQTTTELAVSALLGCEDAGCLVGTYG